MTEWWPSNGSYIEFRNNFNGFIENNQDSEDSRQQVNVVAEMVLNVTIDLDANHSGTYKCLAVKLNICNIQRDIIVSLVLSLKGKQLRPI